MQEVDQAMTPFFKRYMNSSTLTYKALHLVQGTLSYNETPHFVQLIYVNNREKQIS
jgi:hypothetical protein